MDGLDPKILPLLTNVPLQQPPPGQVSNFIDPPSSGHLVTIVGSIFLVPQLLFYGVRMYTKIFVARRLRWDDRMSKV